MSFKNMMFNLQKYNVFVIVIANSQIGANKNEVIFC